MSNVVICLFGAHKVKLRLTFNLNLNFKLRSSRLCCSRRHKDVKLKTHLMNTFALVDKLIVSSLVLLLGSKSSDT